MRILYVLNEFSHYNVTEICTRDDDGIEVDRNKINELVLYRLPNNDMRDDEYLLSKLDSNIDIIDEILYARTSGFLNYCRGEMEYFPSHPIHHNSLIGIADYTDYNISLVEFRPNQYSLYINSRRNPDGEDLEYVRTFYDYKSGTKLLNDLTKYLLDKGIIYKPIFCLKLYKNIDLLSYNLYNDIPNQDQFSSIMKEDKFWGK